MAWYAPLLLNVRIQDWSRCVVHMGIDATDFIAFTEHIQVYINARLDWIYRHLVCTNLLTLYVQTC